MRENNLDNTFGDMGGGDGETVRCEHPHATIGTASANQEKAAQRVRMQAIAARRRNPSTVPLICTSIVRVVLSETGNQVITGVGLDHKVYALKYTWRAPPNYQTTHDAC